MISDKSVFPMGSQVSETSEVPEVAKLAIAYYRGGLYCSEALLKAFNETYQLGLPENSYKMATGFGSGMGESGCACGAITSCVMVLGMVAGRTHKGESEEIVYQAVKALQDRFKAVYKSVCCRVLTKEHEWGSKAHKSQCELYVAEAAAITHQLLCEDLKLYLPQNGSKKIPNKLSLGRLFRRLHGSVNRHSPRTK